MPNPLQITLSEKQRAELEELRDHSQKAYLRERAAAILKIGEGKSASEVARSGLLKRRQYQTVCDWVQRFQRAGIVGLVIRQGRGRKAAFSPSLPQPSERERSTAEGGSS